MIMELSSVVFIFKAFLLIFHNLTLENITFIVISETAT